MEAPPNCSEESKEDSEAFMDLRDHISAKKSFQSRNNYNSVPYLQNFGNKFVPNLSVLDALMSLGPETGSIVAESSRGDVNDHLPPNF